MRCKKAQPLLSLELDRRLSPAQSRALQEHLASCEACGEVARRMAETWDLLGSAASAPGAPDDWRAIEARLGQRPRRALAWLRELWLATPGRLATAGVLCAFLGVGAGAGVWMSRGLKPAMPVEAVAMAEAFGEVPGAVWLAGEGQVRP